MFEVGEVIQTRGIVEACNKDPDFLIEIVRAFGKYEAQNWGDTCESDAEQNDRAINSDERIVAKYSTSKGNIFIITEWDRSYTTILFASEY